ncbi:hypothetical protein KST95_08290 [Fusobacterium nucleatum]|uniref:hypothetical protein n=1 Tax=Fusobacterium nucleatum TaxID=851 RepID=UPI0030D474D6
MSDIDYIKEFLKTKFKDNYQSLKFVSKRDDGNCNEPMFNSEFEMYNFDKGILKNDNPLCAVDGLDIQSDCIYFIEFKDGKIFDKEKEKKKIRLKLLESLIEIQELLNFSSFDRINNLKKIFILVYNKEKNLKVDIFPDDFKKEREENSKNNFKQFCEQLLRYKRNGIYTDIIFFDKDEFQENYISKYLNDKNCRKSN